MQVVLFSVLLDYSYLDELRKTLFNKTSVKNPDMFLCTDRMKRLFINWMPLYLNPGEDIRLDYLFSSCELWCFSNTI